jgi:hypothetical protein
LFQLSLLPEWLSLHHSHHHVKINIDLLVYQILQYDYVDTILYDQ